MAIRIQALGIADLSVVFSLNPKANMTVTTAANISGVIQNCCHCSSVDHLGQIRKVYLETSGELSIYLREDKQVTPGLPIFPEDLEQPLTEIKLDGTYACIYCGHLQSLAPQQKPACDVCENTAWLQPLSNTRIPA